MSGIGAIYNRTGRPLNPVLMDRMLEVIAHRGPDARRMWSDGYVGLGHALLASTPEPVHQRQPLLAPDGASCITFDGRIDNRTELQPALEHANVELRTDTDAELMLGAYRLWGEACLTKVLGDFALVIWDARRQQLLCARDILGLRPCYYYTDDNVFICGSELQQLFAAGLPQPPPNEGMIGEYLSSRITNREETLYRNVYRLPPAHFMLVTRDSVVKRQYFNLDPSRAIHYRSDAEYAEHYMSLFNEAVRCRLRSRTPVAAYLSGGLDSSSIVCLVEHLRREQAIPAITFETLSMVAPGMPGDETPYIDDVVRRWNVTSHKFEIQAPDRHTFVEQVQRYRDVPEHPNVIAAAPLARAASERGCRVILTGLGGDDWLCAYSSHGPELLARLRLVEFMRYIRRQSDSASDTAQALVRRGAWPLLPEPFRAAVRRIRGRSGVPHYITPGFARETSLADRLNVTPCDYPGASRTQNELYRWFFDGGLLYAHEVDDRHHAWFGLDARHPFHDRRLIEFALAIPEEQRWRSSDTKFVLRQGMGELLPASVRMRLDKGGYSQTFMQAFEACGGERCVDALESVRRGWVREKDVTSMYKGMCDAFALGDLEYARDTVRLWMLYGVDLWLKHAFN